MAEWQKNLINFNNKNAPNSPKFWLLNFFVTNLPSQPSLGCHSTFSPSHTLFYSLAVSE